MVVVVSEEDRADIALAAELLHIEPGRRLAGEWNDAHSAEITTEKHEKHKFSPHAKDCAELNTERLEDEEAIKTDNWPGGFYMEVLHLRCGVNQISANAHPSATTGVGGWLGCGQDGHSGLPHGGN